MALATRALASARTGAARRTQRRSGRDSAPPNPAAVLKMAERVIREGAAREGKVAADIGPEDARCLLEAWLAGMGLEPARPRADRLPAVRRLLPRRPLPPRPPHPRPPPARRGRERRRGGRAAATSPAAVNGLFEALRAGGSLRALDRLPRRREGEAAPAATGEPRRVALIADGIGSMHGVTHTIEQIRERGVPGFEVDVVGTDPGVDRRLPAAAELELPFYEGMRLGVPGLPDLVETLAEGGYDLVHVTAPGPAGIAATLLEPDHRRAAARQLPHRARRLRRHAQRRRAASRRWPGPASAPSTAPPASCSRRAPPPTPRWSALGTDAGPDRPLGARGRHRPLRPGQGRPRRLPGRDQGPLRRPADPREGGRPAGRELPPRPRRRPAPAPAAGRRRPRGGRAARAARRARHLPRLARRRGAGPRLRQRRRLPLRQQHRHLRPGDPRGGGQRPAGRRRRRGRPGGAGREPPHRPALPSRRRPPRRGAAAARLLAAAAPPARRRRAPRGPRPLLGAGAGPARRPATGAPWRRRRGAAGSRSPRSPEAAGDAGGASVRWADRRSRSLLQPRALLARLQPAGSRAGRGPRGAAAGAAPLLRRSTPPTSTSSSWSGSPASSTSSTPGSTPAAPTASPRASRSTRSRPGCWSSTAASTPASAAILRPALEEQGIRIVTLDDAPARRSGARSTPASTSRSSRR